MQTKKTKGARRKSRFEGTLDDDERMVLMGFNSTLRAGKNLEKEAKQLLHLKKVDNEHNQLKVAKQKNINNMRRRSLYEHNPMRMNSDLLQQRAAQDLMQSGMSKNHQELDDLLLDNKDEMNNSSSSPSRMNSTVHKLPSQMSKKTSMTN